MKRVSKTSDTSPCLTDESPVRVKRKRRNKVNDEFSIDAVKEEPIDDFESSLNESSIAFEDNQTEISDEADPLSNKKRKKKKKKKLKTEDDSIIETGDNEVESPAEIKSDNANGFVKVDTWSKNKVVQLLDRIQEHIPENDNLKYSSRLTKLDWDAISFDEYSAEDCRNMWKRIQDKTRCYRLMKEVLSDAREGVMHGNSFYGCGKADKHPEKPVKPLTSYMLFYLDTKDKITKLNPKMSCPEQAKKVSELWKNLPPKKLEKYKIRAQKLKNEYNEKLAEFYTKHPEYLEEKKKKVKINSDILGFEKPKSAFKLFHQSCQLNYENKGSKLSGTEILEKAKEKWKNMPEKKKVVWIEAAQKEEAKYREMLKQYELEHPGFVLPTVKTLITKNDRHILENVSGKPKKPPVNAYSLFSVLMLQGDSLKEIPAKERLPEISRKWKSMSKAERDDYAKQLQEMQEQYKIQYAEYINSLPPEKRHLEEEKSRLKRKKQPHQDVKVTVEPEAPTTNVIELFKQKHQHEWKKKSKTNLDELAKKKWDALSSAKKKEYIDELKRINEEYLDTFGRFLQQCAPDKVTQYLIKITDHKKKLDMANKQVKMEDSEDTEPDSNSD